MPHVPVPDAVAEESRQANAGSDEQKVLYCDGMEGRQLACRRVDGKRRKAVLDRGAHVCDPDKSVHGRAFTTAEDDTSSYQCRHAREQVKRDHVAGILGGMRVRRPSENHFLSTDDADRRSPDPPLFKVTPSSEH